MVILKTKGQIDNIRKSCKIVAYVLDTLKKEAKAGATTSYLNNLAETLCLDKGCRPGFKNYKGFPYSLCCSKNNVVVHGFPDDIPLEDGDTLSLDFGVVLNGWWGDAAITIPIGKASDKTSKLIEATMGCLSCGIGMAKVNNRIGDISEAIQSKAESYGFAPAREFVGHGVGRNLHEEPQIPNFGAKNDGVLIKPGAVLAIEPIICIGSGETLTLSDGWNVITKDGNLSAHFEHTIVVTGDGVEILTILD